MPKSKTYEEFVEKFKPKLTTDDCYTPPVIYDAVANWVAEEYCVDRANFVRPFWPGADFETYEYKPTDIVVDNPPFSILRKIYDFYAKHGIRYFLFCQGVTALSSRANHCVICTSFGITYENGADVNTSFVTNLDTENIARSAPDLYARLKVANQVVLNKIKNHVPAYKYPPEVVTAANIGFMSVHGTDYKLRRGAGLFIRTLDEQREKGKGIFGAGYLLSNAAAAEKAAAEKAAAEKAAAEKAAAHVWKLSERERQLVAQLSE